MKLYRTKTQDLGMAIRLCTELRPYETLEVVSDWYMVLANFYDIATDTEAGYENWATPDSSLQVGFDPSYNNRRSFRITGNIGIIGASDGSLIYIVNQCTSASESAADFLSTVLGVPVLKIRQ